MRIAHVITRMIVGGAQENTLLSCQGLMRLFGDDVLLITGPALGPEGNLLVEGRGAEVPQIVLPDLRRAIHPVRDVVSYREIRRVLGEFRPDVVHTHSAKGGFLGRLAASSLGVAAIVHTVHGAPFHAYQSRGARAFFRCCETYAARRCHALVSVADAMTDQLVASGVAPREKFRTIYSGMEVAPFLDADLQRAAAREQLGFTDGQVVVGKIARLFHLKGHEYLIKAAAQVIASQPQVRFLLVGDGVLSRELQEQIRGLGLEPYFHFAGLVDPAEIPRMIAAMDVLVHCSLREGLARALPQALLAARPVVSYDVDGAREVVVSGETGYLLPPRSVEPLAAAICSLAADEPQRRRLGQAGRERCVELFHRETMTRSLRQLYEEILAGRPFTAGQPSSPRAGRQGTD